MQVGKKIKIVLASASPRRHELVSAMGLSFEVVTSDIDETPHPQEAPLALAHRLSQAKAEAVARDYIDAITIAADTLVVLDERILGKPRDKAEAVTMLTQLRDRRHLVYTGLAVLNQPGQRRCAQVAITPVRMRNYSNAEIQRYVATGDPMDKAGAYAIQYPEWNPVAGFEGCYTNVMGLPMCHLYRILRSWAVEVPRHPLESCPYALQEGCPYAREILQATSVPCIEETET